MNTIQEHWESYNEKVINPNAGPQQRLETKRAFYSGAFVTLKIILSLPTDISEDAGAAIIEGLEKEIVSTVQRECI